MLRILKILVTAQALAACAALLSACGQKGPLVLPNAPESVGRATLPQTLNPWHTPAGPAVPATAPHPAPESGFKPALNPASEPAAQTAR